MTSDCPRIFFDVECWPPALVFVLSRKLTQGSAKGCKSRETYFQSGSPTVSTNTRAMTTAIMAFDSFSCGSLISKMFRQE